MKKILTPKSTLIAVVIMGLVSYSCARKEIVDPEFLLIDKTKDITVYTFDKRKFHFDRGEYGIIRKGNVQFIKGKGKQYDPGTKFYDIFFDGELGFHEIEHIEWRSKTTVGTLGDIFIWIPAVLIFLFLYWTYTLGGFRT